MADMAWAATVLRHHPKSNSVPDLGLRLGLGLRSESDAESRGAVPPVSRRCSTKHNRSRSASNTASTSKLARPAHIGPSSASSTGGGGNSSSSRSDPKPSAKSNSRSNSHSSRIFRPPTRTFGRPPIATSMPFSTLEEQLFALSKLPLHDFESIMAFLPPSPPAYPHPSSSPSHYPYPYPSSSSFSPSLEYYRTGREKMLWQTYKTFERLLKRDFEERHLQLVKTFTEQCVRTYALLDYAADCGHKRLREYVRHLVLTPELARVNYLSRMMSLPPHDRLEFINRPVPDQLQKLKLFCLLYDHLYEKIERETRHRMEKTLLDRFHTRLETVQARLSRGLQVQVGSGLGHNSNVHHSLGMGTVAGAGAGVGMGTERNTDAGTGTNTNAGNSPFAVLGSPRTEGAGAGAGAGTSGAMGRAI